MAFKLKSGNRTPFKQMGSSPLKQEVKPDKEWPDPSSNQTISSQVEDINKDIEKEASLTVNEKKLRSEKDRKSANVYKGSPGLLDQLGISDWINSKELGLLHLIFPAYQHVHDTRIKPEVKIHETKQEIEKEASTLERREGESDESYNNRVSEYKKSIEAKGDQEGNVD